MSAADHAGWGFRAPVTLRRVSALVVREDDAAL
jgi:hypothetical protein